METAARDTSTCPEVGGDVARAVVVIPPTPNATIDSECDGVVVAPRDA